MRIKNPGEAFGMAAIAAIMCGAGRDMLEIWPRFAIVLLGVSALGALMAIETAVGSPLLNRLFDRLYDRRMRRETAERSMAEASMRIAFEEGLAKTRAYAAARRR